MSFKEIIAKFLANKLLVAAVAGTAVIGGGAIIVNQMDTPNVPEPVTVEKDGVVIIGEGLEGYSMDIVRYDENTDEYRNAFNGLNGNDEKVNAIEVMDIILKNKDGKETDAETDVKAEIILQENTVKATGNYILWDKGFIAVPNAVFSEDKVEFTSKSFGRIVISKIEKIEVKDDEKNEDKDKDKEESSDKKDEENKNTSSDKNNGKDENKTDTTNKNNGTSDKTETAKIDINEADIDGCGDQKYTGKELKPVPKLTYKGKTLKKGTDYTVTYKNNINPGKGKVIITGKGNFTGTMTETFEIIKQEEQKPSTGVKTLTLNVATTSHGFRGYYTKDSNVLNFKFAELGLASDNSLGTLFVTEFYDAETGELIYFAIPQDVVFGDYDDKVDAAGGYESIPVRCN